MSRKYSPAWKPLRKGSRELTWKEEEVGGERECRAAIPEKPRGGWAGEAPGQLPGWPRPLLWAWVRWKPATVSDEEAKVTFENSENGTSQPLGWLLDPPAGTYPRRVSGCPANVRRPGGNASSGGKRETYHRQKVLVLQKVKLSCPVPPGTEQGMTEARKPWRRRWLSCQGNVRRSIAHFSHRKQHLFLLRSQVILLQVCLSTSLSFTGKPEWLLVNLK